MNEGESRARQRIGSSLLLSLSVVVVTWFIELSPGMLWSRQGVSNAWDIFQGLLSPDLSLSFLQRVFQLMGESVAIGVLGTLGALLLALPLSLIASQWPSLAAPPSPPKRWNLLSLGVRLSARTILSFLRSVPDLVWAFLFVRVLGLGPGPAVFAIALSFGGIIGKLYAELIEACDPKPIRKLQAAGVGMWGLLWFGILPQVRKQWVGYALFRLECAIRSAAVLGLVGAGGIGSEIALSLRYYQYDKLSTALLAVLLVVVSFESTSAWIRRRHPSWSLALLGSASLCSLWTIDIPWSDWLHPSALQQITAFVRGFASPHVTLEFCYSATAAMAQTLGMAWVATCSAAFVAFLISPFAATVLWRKGTLPDPPQPIGPSGWLSLPILGISRLLFQVTRSIPDLVWALIFVVWVGPGPLAGTLAIAFHTLGVLGRLFGEVYEEAEKNQVKTLETLGTPTWGRWMYGILPQSLPRLLAYSLFRLEVNIRATAVIGFVGAGGIGDEIHTAISLFHFDKLATLGMILFFSVVLVDTIGHHIRQTWLAPRLVTHSAHHRYSTS